MFVRAARMTQGVGLREIRAATTRETNSAGTYPGRASIKDVPPRHVPAPRGAREQRNRRGETSQGTWPACAPAHRVSGPGAIRPSCAHVDMSGAPSVATQARLRPAQGDVCLGDVPHRATSYTRATSCTRANLGFGTDVQPQRPGSPNAVRAPATRGSHREHATPPGHRGGRTARIHLTRRRFLDTDSCRSMTYNTVRRGHDAEPASARRNGVRTQRGSVGPRSASAGNSPLYHRVPGLRWFSEASSSPCAPDSLMSRKHSGVRSVSQRPRGRFPGRRNRARGAPKHKKQQSTKLRVAPSHPGRGTRAWTPRVFLQINK